MAAPRLSLLATACLLVSLGCVAGRTAVQISAIGATGVLSNRPDFQTIELADVLGSLAKGSEEASPVVVLASGAPGAGSLKGALLGAGSWTQYPNAFFEAEDDDVVGELLRSLGSETSVLGGCPSSLARAAGSTCLKGAAEAATASPGKPLLVCAAASEAGRVAASIAGAAPARPLAIVTVAGGVRGGGAARALAQAGDESPSPDPAPAPGPDEGYVCDAKCWRQVKYLEGIIVAVIVLATIIIGLTCMHVVDTPTEWGTPKEGRHHHHE